MQFASLIFILHKIAEKPVVRGRHPGYHPINIIGRLSGIITQKKVGGIADG